MTDNEKVQIIKMKSDGMSYRKIASVLEISENTIKSFFKRNSELCPICGNLLFGKKYCSDKCRMAWWRMHPHRTVSMIECSCATCNKTFYAYPSKARKYCSKKCYGISCRKEKRNDK